MGECGHVLVRAREWGPPAALALWHNCCFATRVLAVPHGRTWGSSTLYASTPHEGFAMTKYKLEYIWLDGYTPTPNLRGKTQIKEYASFPTLEDLPLWGFDGSSTMQAEGSNSDCVLKPIRVFPDAAR